MGSWAARIPAVKERLDLGEAELGLALGLVALGALVAMPVSGWMSARGGSRRTTRFAFVGCCIAVAAAGARARLRAAAAGRVAARRGQRLARRRDERARRRRRAPPREPDPLLLPRRLLLRRAGRRGLERARRERRPRRPLAPARRRGRGADRGSCRVPLAPPRRRGSRGRGRRAAARVAAARALGGRRDRVLRARLRGGDRGLERRLRPRVARVLRRRRGARLRGVLGDDDDRPAARRPAHDGLGRGGARAARRPAVGGGASAARC